jgi:uncharacterized protein
VKAFGAILIGFPMVFASACKQDSKVADGDTDFKTGLKCYEGDGAPQDYAEAMKWFRLGADKGPSAAMFGIGTMHADGKGVTPNYGEALKWYRKSADQNHAKAQHDIGLMYARGEGVAQNYA